MIFLLILMLATANSAQWLNSTKFADILERLEVDGCLVVYDENNDRYFYHNLERAQQSFLPASTFKILNSMIALETGAIETDSTIIPWDGVERPFAAWNRDHTLASALDVSAVWAYQELARRIGAERMHHWVQQAAYGNTDIGGGIDTFWLEGDIRITALQQIDFLRRFYHQELPFSQQTQAAVKRIMIREQTDTYTLRHKTGWAMRVQPQVGWFVAILEENGNVYYAVSNIAIEKNHDARAREASVRQAFKAMGLMRREE